MNLNHRLFFALYGLAHRSAIFDAIVTFVAGYGDVTMIFVTGAALVLFFVHDRDWKRRRWIAWGSEVLTVGVASVVPWFVTFLLKMAFAAPRPFVTYLQVRPLVTETPYTSFPSGHATVFFALATVVYLYHRRLGYFFFACAALIALSRVVSGVHYPVDILAGTLIGITCAVFVHRNMPKALSSIFFKKNK